MDSKLDFSKLDFDGVIKPTLDGLLASSGNLAVAISMHPAVMFMADGGELDPETGKLSSPAEPLDQLAQRFDYVLAEADGSKRLPLKAHAPWEPVVPAGTANVIWLVGASGLSKPINEAVHRPELFCERCGCEPTDTATPERVAMVLNAELRMLNLNNARIMLNQVDTLSDPTMADRFEAALNRPLIATSLK